MQILITLLAIALLYVWVIVRSDTHRFVVREYEIISPKIQKPLTLCVLSDLHEKDYGNGNGALAEAILEQKPDAVLSAGDLLTAHHISTDCRDEAVRALLKRLSGQVPVYLGMGNHERKLEDRTDFYGDALARFEEDVKSAGVSVFRNEAPFSLNGVLDLAALDLETAYFSQGPQKPLSSPEVEAHCGKPDDTHFTVLIAHEPSRFVSYANWGADLVLSGHVHGGVIRLFGRGIVNPALKLFPFYDGGAYVRGALPDSPATVMTGGLPRKANKEGVVRHPDGQMIYLKDGMSAMVLSRGLGTHSIHVRFMNPGELVVIRLKPAAEVTDKGTGE